MITLPPGLQGQLDPDLLDRVIRLRRELHAHPELSWQETDTTRSIEGRLRGLGLAPWRPIPTALVCDLPSAVGPAAAPGPIVALRVDTDALPVQEATGLSFASLNPGVMHACGHDGHSAMLVGAAELLLDQPADVPVRLIWQPAEETGAGAPRLIDAGVLDGVAVIFGGHLDGNFLVGELVVTPGAVSASTDSFTVEICGRGGHGGRPQECGDAVVVGSQLVMALQSVVSREVNPGSPAVVSVGSFHGGTACNVIAGQAVLQGTLRAQTPAVREQLRAALRRVCAAVAQLHGVQIDLDLTVGTPALINPGAATALAREAAVRTVGQPAVRRLELANMGGEDFACYLKHTAGCYIRIGCRAPQAPVPVAHSSGFDFDEGALAVGALWLAQVARVAASEVTLGDG